MVDHQTAVATVRNPHADPVLLAKIAYENPEFGASVVANPRAYPGLKRWVAEFGDERARRYLASTGWPVPETDGPDIPTVGETSADASDRLPCGDSGMPDVDIFDGTNIWVPPSGPCADPADLADAADIAPTALHVDSIDPANTTGMASDTTAPHKNPINPACVTDEPDLCFAQDGTAYDAVDVSARATMDGPSHNASCDMDEAHNAQRHSSADEYTAELAMNTENTELMARIAAWKPELRPFLARNMSIYPELLEWLQSLDDNAINAALRLRD